MKKSNFEANKKSSTIQTRSKLRKLTGKYMEDLLSRFPHIGEIIFENLDDQSILSSKQVSKSWYNFINCQKFPWIRIVKNYVKESNKDYTQNPKKWKKLFRNFSVKSVRDFAYFVHKITVKDRKNSIRYHKSRGRSLIGMGLTPMFFAAKYKDLQGESKRMPPSPLQYWNKSGF